ncbi:MAG: SIMPL domain-containing protein [Nonlabens sp.]|uniref:SIMPL domain-containing protein n=1 Tax=Nonlabens sp. TaxID=1888209 RepID=UPI003EF6A84D
MKIITTTFLFLTALSLNAQHLGNFNNQASQMEISRANIATADMGNAKVMNYRPASFGHVQLQPSNILTLNLRSLYNVEATDYTAVFNINQVGETADETTQLMSDKINAIKAALRAKGFNGQFAIDMISFVPQYEIEVTKKLFSKTYTEVPVGFELQQNLLISYRDDADFEKILSACASAEVYNLVKVDYYVKNLEAIYADLQTKLLAEVKKKKEYYTALGFDMQTYDVHMADAKYYHMPKDHYKSYVAANNISMDALKQKKGVTRIKKPISYYYDPIPHAGYDIVVNAAITKPVIQLGMNLTLRYVPKPKEPAAPVAPVKEPKPKVYVVSPNGPIDIKQLPNS